MRTQRLIPPITWPRTMAERLTSASATRLLPLLFLLALPTEVHAQSYTNSDGIWTYTNESGTITITGYTGSGGAVTTPDTVNGLPVTSIGDYAFEYNAGLTSVTIGTNVTSIGYAAFYRAGLTSVTIPDSVTTIGEAAFGGCFSLIAITVDALNSSYSSSADGVLFNKSQTTLIQYPEGKAAGYTIPSSVTSIGDDAFADCERLANITVPNSVTSIGNSAFNDCTSLTAFTIPSSVISIGGAAFGGSTMPVAITVNTNNPAYSSVNGVLFDKNQTTLIGYPGGIGGSYTIPYGVLTISDWAFEGSGVTSVTIANSVTSIGVEAFVACRRLTSVTIPDSVTSIWAGAFDSCTHLTSVTIPSSVTNVGVDAFNYCTSLTSVTIPGSVAAIGQYAFAGCTSLTGVYFQGNAPSADLTVFDGDRNATVYYLPGTTGWGTTFGGLPTALWGAGSFGALQVSISPPSVVTAGAQWQVDGGEWRNTGTISSNLSVGVHTVAFSTVAGWSTPTNQIVPVSPNRTTTAAGTYLPVVAGFDYTINNGTITITKYTGPGGSVTIPDTIDSLPVTSIGVLAFESSGLSSVTIGTNVTSIGDSAFSGCTSLASATIPDSVTSIEDGAFFDCTSLTNVTIPQSVTSVGSSPFDACSSLTAITVNANNPNYSSLNGVLFDKAKTTLIECPGGIAGGYTIPSSVSILQDYSFAYCTRLTEVTIPDGVSNIPDGAFEGCDGLTNVTITGVVTNIG
ncbi:MAG: leucine-rich repeat domain-containing protein, partial [Limisphaerales bacterium]